MVRFARRVPVTAVATRVWRWLAPGAIQYGRAATTWRASWLSVTYML